MHVNLRANIDAWLYIQANAAREVQLEMVRTRNVLVKSRADARYRAFRLALIKLQISAAQAALKLGDHTSAGCDRMPDCVEIVKNRPVIHSHLRRVIALRGPERVFRPKSKAGTKHIISGKSCEHAPQLRPNVPETIERLSVRAVCRCPKPERKTNALRTGARYSREQKKKQH